MPASPAQLPSATLRDRSLAVAAQCRQRRTHRHFLPWLNDERLDDAAFENFDFDDALLGSTSATTSPRLTASPGFTRHSTTVPYCISAPSEGMRNSLMA
jgi:hypothetical protein